MTPRASSRVLTGVAAVVMAMGAATGAAWAHSSEIGTTPEDGSVLDTAPTQVQVEFDSDLLDMGAAIVVRDAAGASVVVGTPEIGPRSLTVDVDGRAGPGEYQVAYRVVSEDGHTIESTFGYTVAGTRADVASPAATPTATPPTEAVPTAPPVEAAPTAESEGSNALPWILAGGAVLVLLAVGGTLALRR